MRKAKRPERVKLYDDELPFAKKPDPDRGPDRLHYDDGPSRRERDFVHRYLACYRNAELAAIDIGVPARRAFAAAQEMLRRPHVQAYIKTCELESLYRLQLDVDLVTKGQFIRATTPVTECFDIIIPPCRYCWGTNNEYQRTHGELERDFERHQRDLARWNAGRKNPVTKPPPFDEKGGIGYDYKAAPNPDCPNCHGDPTSAGVEAIAVLKDTRMMSLAGKMLLSGVTIKDGRVVPTLRDADAASAQFMATFRDMFELSRAEGGTRVLDMRGRGAAGLKQITRVERVIVSVEKRTEKTEVS